MKVKIKIAELARQHNFKNAYALQNALKCSPTMASRLWSGEFKRIDIETMVKLCELFQCSPNELFGYESAPVAPVADKPKQKPLLHPGFEQAAKSGVFNNSILEIVNSSSDNEYVLTTADAGKILDRSSRQVRTYAERGELPGKQGKQDHWFFRRSDVDEYKARRDKK
jgi:DNA-binding Xre family transcriptional regulator